MTLITNLTSSRTTNGASRHLWTRSSSHTDQCESFRSGAGRLSAEFDVSAIADGGLSTELDAYDSPTDGLSAEFDVNAGTGGLSPEFDVYAGAGGLSAESDVYAGTGGLSAQLDVIGIGAVAAPCTPARTRYGTVDR